MRWSATFSPPLFMFCCEWIAVLSARWTVGQDKLQYNGVILFFISPPCPIHTTYTDTHLHKKKRKGRSYLFIRIGCEEAIARVS
jgi:hypothetical protein